MKTLALVPARAGSKGVPGKNTRMFRGLPLIAWAIKVGLETCDLTVVSTDSLEIGWIAQQHGAQVMMRGAELAQDDTPMLPVIQHVLRNWLMKWDEKPDVVVLLQPSSPSVARAAHVHVALKLLEERWPGQMRDSDSVVSVVEECHDLLLLDSGNLYASDARVVLDDLPKRRQDCAPSYRRDGTVYAIRREVIERGRLYGTDCRALIIPEAHSCTIDTEADWLAAEAKHAQVR